MSGLCVQNTPATPGAHFKTGTDTLKVVEFAGIVSVRREPVPVLKPLLFRHFVTILRQRECRMKFAAVFGPLVIHQDTPM
jgi:hypothetical protein